MASVGLSPVMDHPVPCHIGSNLPRILVCLEMDAPQLPKKSFPANLVEGVAVKPSCRPDWGVLDVARRLDCMGKAVWQCESPLVYSDGAHHIQALRPLVGLSLDACSGSRFSRM